jgi:ribonuclease HI
VEENNMPGMHMQEKEEEDLVFTQNWSPPPAGWVKLNTDVGYRHSPGEASTGVVVRDDRGNVLLSAWKSLQHVASAEEAEAEACLQGLKLVAEWIRQPACVEADCATLIQAINRREEDRLVMPGDMQTRWRMGWGSVRWVRSKLL